MSFSDAELVREIRTGSGVAFEQLMRRHERLVFKVAYGFTGDADSAMDVTQNTFLKVHSRLASWRREGNLRNWIARIAANEALNWIRSGQRSQSATMDQEALQQPDRSHEERLRERETREALSRSLAQLNPRQRLAVVLRYFQGMSTREIAAVLQCSEGTARNLLFRSLRRLRRVLGAATGVLS